MKYSNPARRLHTILSEGALQNQNLACGVVWAELLNAEANSSELLRKLARVMMLPDQILSIVEEEFPARHSIQKHWAEPVKAGFQHQNLKGQWQSFSGHIKEHVVDFLAMTSDLIEERVAPDDISDDDLLRLRDAFLKVQAEVHASGLSEKIKLSLSKAIARILMAIDDYKISGSAEMLAAIDMALGKATYDVEYRETLSKSEVGNNFLNAINIASSVITVSTAIPLITTGLTNLLKGS